MVLDDGRGELDDDDNGLDKEAFVLVVFEIGTEVIEAVVGILFEVGSYQHRRILIE